MTLFDMKKRREELLSKCEGVLKVAEIAKRQATEDESKIMDECMVEINALNPQIERVEKLNTLRTQFPTGRVLTDLPANGSKNARRNHKKRVLTPEYVDAFSDWAASRGRQTTPELMAGLDDEGGFVFPVERRMQAASYESSNPAGGYAVPSQVAGEIIPLAPPEFGVYKLATVLPTSMDIKFPRKGAHGTAAAKTESGASTHDFGGTDATLEQFTLSAFMVGHVEDASWELLQDVNAFQAFMTDDILLSIAILKEAGFCTGSGSSESQGLIGNTGTGTGTPVEPDTAGNLISINSTYDVLGVLNAIYHPGASWLMQRATSISVRKAQTQSNLFSQVWNRVGNQDFLHGYPVEYSTSMPANSRGNVPVLFGDFKRGYIIGERGGAGVNVKILDQTKAVSGLLQVLGYQRVDGRVRRSEAIQQIKVALS
jgi:HK97 family phage major capsid protein